ncbi:MAG: hypothetical protein IKP81_08440 [Paludibacteraceae bacterium]|nr:hypothetical protein [Paludibacteraceae bacterium]
MDKIDVQCSFKGINFLSAALDTDLFFLHRIHYISASIGNFLRSKIADIKSRYRSAQVKAAVKVNAEKLLFNWQLGCDLAQKKAEERWGAGVVEQVSLDLKREFPDADGFSTSNLWYMKKWYLFYADGDAEEKLQRAVGELQSSVNQAVIKLQQSVGERQHLV